MPDYPEILGVYSLRRGDEIGVGATTAKREQLTYWYVRRLDDSRYEVQPLNAAHVPSGLRKEVKETDFLRQYSPEPAYYRNYTVPALNALARKVAQGDEFLLKGDLDEAERQFLKALMIDDRSVQANYGLGEVYSEQKNFDKLKKVLHTLIGQDEAFKQEHRERFNSFGISLRKNRHFDDSVLFYTKALELNAQDEHVYFNMARAQFDKGDLGECLRHLNIALALNPQFDEARKFLDFCEKQQPAQHSPQ